MRKLLAPAALVLLGAAGCGTVPMMDGAGAPLTPLTRPEAAAIPTLPDEPAVCLIGLDGRFNDIDIYSAFLEEGRFRSFRALTAEYPEPDGCDVFVEITQKGASNLGESIVAVHSAYGGALVDEYHYGGGPVVGFGFITLARHLKASLQPGTPLRAKLGKLRAANPAPDAALVKRLAGDRLRSMSVYNDANLVPLSTRRHRVEPRPVVKAAPVVAEDSDGAGRKDDAPVVKPWWSKP